MKLHIQPISIDQLRDADGNEEKADRMLKDYVFDMNRAKFLCFINSTILLNTDALLCGNPVTFKMHPMYFENTLDLDLEKTNYFNQGFSLEFNNDWITIRVRK